MLTIRLLGQFHVERDGKAVPLNSRPAQSLLAYLLIHAGKAVRREMLAGMLWPEATEAGARNNLRQALWRVRKSIEAGPADTYLLVNDIALQFNQESEYFLDVDRLTIDLNPSAPIDDLIRAVSVYSGELLPGFYDDWIVLAREQLHTVYERKMALLLDRLEKDLRWEEAIAWSERWIAHGSVPEPAYRSLMLAYAAQGDLAGMGTAFKRCERAMQEELGLDPSEPTLALYRQLKEGHLPDLPPAAASPPEPIPVEPDRPAPGDSPYKGLQSYEAADADSFFGRDEVVADMLRRIRDGVRFLAVVGASGSGKSSVVRAGLVPALTAALDRNVVVLTPTADPRAALAERLPAVPTGTVLVIDQFEELFTLCKDESERSAFVEALSEIIRAGDQRDITLVITLRADFYANCGQYPRLREALAEHQVYLGQMNARELRQVIEGPAAVGGWQLEPGLADLILRDISREPGALPLLSHALLETWHRRRGRVLTVEGYARSGGVRGAIARTAETVYNLEFSADQRRIARNILIRLIELGEGVEPTRRRVERPELFSAQVSPELVQSVVEKLVDARLITADENTVEIAHEALIHEWPALQSWLAEDRAEILLHRRLTEAAQAWEAFDRDPGELYRGARLSQAEEWVDARHPDLSLLEQEFLHAAIAQKAEQAAQLRSREERELRAALELAQAQQQKAAAERELIANQARSLAQLRQRAVYLTIALFLALSMAGVALFLGERVRQVAITAQENADRAEMESRIAFSRELAAASVATSARDSDLAILLALEAVATAQQAGLDTPREAVEALHQAVTSARLRYSYSGGFNVAFTPDGERIAHSGTGEAVILRPFPEGGEQRIDTGHSGDLFGVNVLFDPAGRWLLTASADGTAKLWDAATGALQFTLAGHSASITDAAISPDGNWAATTGNDDFVRVWDLTTGDQHFQMEVEGVSGVAIDSASRAMAFGRDLVGDGRITILDLKTGEERLVLAGHELGAADVLFDHAGVHIYSVGFDGMIKVWDVQTGALLAQVEDLPPIYSLALNPDGNQLAVGAISGETLLWELPDLDPLHRFQSHRDFVTGLAFSPDGRYLATSGIDGFTRVWDISREGNSELAGLAGHDAVAYSVDFSPDGSRLATSSWDKTSIIWDTATGSQLLALPDFQEGVARIRFSPDGSLVATADYSGRLGVWDARSGIQLASWIAHPPGDIDVAFSPDGKVLGSAGADGFGRLWDSSDGALLAVLEGHTGGIHRVAFSTGGEWFATAGLDGSARIWDARTGTLAVELVAEAGEVKSVDFSPGDRLVATAHEDGTVRIWELDAVLRDQTRSRPLLALSGHNSVVWDAAFNPAGDRLATISFDGTVRLWDAATGEEILSLPGGNDGPDLDFSPDGSQLATTSGDGVVRVFALLLEDLIRIAEGRLTREFTQAECVQYLHLERCP